MWYNSNTFNNIVGGECMSLTVHWNVLMPVVGYNQLNELKFTEIRFNTHIQKPPHTRLQKNHKYLRTHIYRGISDLCVCVLVYFTYAPNFHLIHTSMLFFLLFMDDYSLIWVFCCPNRRRGRGGIHAKETPESAKQYQDEWQRSAAECIWQSSAAECICFLLSLYIRLIKYSHWQKCTHNIKNKITFDPAS